MNIIKKIAKPLRLPLFVLLLFSFGQDDFLNKIEVADVAAWIKTFQNILPVAVQQKLYDLRWASTILFVVDIVIVFFRPMMHVIEHSSFSSSLEELSDDLRKEYFIKKHIIDLQRYIDQMDFGKAIVEQDTTLAKIAKRKARHIGYYGIAHTPFVFRAGYLMGDQRNYHLFHKQRNNKSKFKEWSNDSSSAHFPIKIQEVGEDMHTDELYVALGTSFQIKENEVESIAGNNAHILFIQSSNIGFDVITSYQDAESLRSQILHKIRSIQKEKGIKKLHLMISSSVAFTFFLATAFSPQHDPEIIVYHYENGHYSWGINMKESGEDAVVRVNH